MLGLKSCWKFFHCCCGSSWFSVRYCWGKSTAILNWMEIVQNFLYNTQVKHLKINKTCPLGHSSALLPVKRRDECQVKTLGVHNELSKLLRSKNKMQYNEQAVNALGRYSEIEENLHYVHIMSDQAMSVENFYVFIKSNRKLLSQILGPYIDGLAQDCSNSSALAMESLESCAKSLIWCFPFCPHRWWHCYVVAQNSWNNLYAYLSMNKCHTRCECVEVEEKYFLSPSKLDLTNQKIFVMLVAIS